MREFLIFLVLGAVLFSCKKDKVPMEEPCINVELTGKRAAVVGKCRWYKTWGLQTFASGNTYTLDYTPATEGFDYFILTSDGKFKGYKDSVLIDESNLTSFFVDNDNCYGSYRLCMLANCSDKELNMCVFSSDSTEDILGLIEAPLNFDDPIQKKKTSYNFFKRI